MTDHPKSAPYVTAVNLLWAAFEEGSKIERNRLAQLKATSRARMSLVFIVSLQLQFYSTNGASLIETPPP